MPFEINIVPAEEYINKFKELQSEQKNFQKIKLRNNILLGVAVVSCLALSTALLVIPPVGIAISTIVGISIAAGVVTKIGDSLHKKWCINKEEKISHLTQQLKEKKQKVIEQGFSISEEKNKVIIQHKESEQKFEVEKYSYTRLSLANKILTMAREYLGVANQTIYDDGKNKQAITYVTGNIHPKNSTEDLIKKGIEKLSDIKNDNLTTKIAQNIESSQQAIKELRKKDNPLIEVEQAKTGVNNIDSSITKQTHKITNNLETSYNSNKSNYANSSLNKNKVKHRSI